jgi:alkylation response protein AidB-like acyl-CoA dehydrogenase
MPINRQECGRHSYQETSRYTWHCRVLAAGYRTCRLPAETARSSGGTQIYEGTNQIQRMVMARQLLK